MQSLPRSLVKSSAKLLQSSPERASFLLYKGKLLHHPPSIVSPTRPPSLALRLNHFQTSSAPPPLPIHKPTGKKDRFPMAMAREVPSVVHRHHGNGGGGGGLVVTELSHIKELVRQLELHLGGSPDLCRHLAAQIFSLTERSIGLVTAAGAAGATANRKRSASSDAGLASPLSVSAAGTPTSGVTTKKRKGIMEARRDQVRVASPTGAAGDNPVVDDGHSWRKYGQKEILGAKHPRGYYRCTHRHSQGCMATKQLQRTDHDAALFDVIYHGEHTCCVHKPAAVQGAQSPQQGPPPPELHNPGARTLLQSLTAGLTVKTEGLLPALAAADPQAWSATTAPFGRFSAAPPSTSERDNCWGVSPATSDSNHVASYLQPPFHDADWREQAELQEVVSALVAASAPPPAVDSLDDILDIDIDIASFFA